MASSESALATSPPIMPSSTAEKPGTEPGGLIKVRPCQSHSRAEASGSLVADWHLPLCKPIFFPFFSPVWSLIKSLHPKLQLSICFRRTQSITHAPESLILFFSLYQDHSPPPRSSSNDTFKKYFLIFPMRNNYSFYSTPPKLCLYLYLASHSFFILHLVV